MKQIFEWLREKTEANSEHYKEKADYIWEEELSAFNQGISKGMRIAKTLVAEAEAKWESECCEWKPNDKDLLKIYNSTCGRISVANPYWNFCPYCGKPIKISEVE